MINGCGTGIGISLGSRKGLHVVGDAINSNIPYDSNNPSSLGGMQALASPTCSFREQRQLHHVELRCHHAGKTTRWAPRIISKDNGAVAQIVRK